ncbi:MAG: hypothetical protein JWO95_585, partial [Verrucomicrobiales bacterium]|nr:hypothetical protein [Verrucomicrobiales bacterium]
MKMQNTPLVQKLILVMLVLIFGCLVLMLVNGRKQIESLREGPPISTSVSSTNDDASVRPAYPSMRSSKPRGTTVAPEPAQRELSTVDGRTAQNFEAPAVIQQQPQILPTAAVIQSPETQSAEPGISGRVVLVGMPPQEIPIRFDATCGQLHPTETTTRRFVVSPDGGLANAFVYISKGLEGKTFATRTNTVFIDQTNCMYQPYIVGEMVNQPIEIMISD